VLVPAEQVGQKVTTFAPRQGEDPETQIDNVDGSAPVQLPAVAHHGRERHLS